MRLENTRRVRLVLFVCALGMIVVAIGLAVFGPKPWAIPPADKQLRNPLTPTQANLDAAKKTYADKCSNCHGDQGKGDGPDAMMYDPAPTDLTDAATINKRTDGEIYYQITVGRKPMPSFRKKLTDEERWRLVLFVRALAAGQQVK